MDKMPKEFHIAYHDGLYMFADPMVATVNTTKYTRTDTDTLTITKEELDGMHSTIDMDVEDKLGREITIDESKIVGLTLKIYAAKMEGK